MGIKDPLAATSNMAVKLFPNAIYLWWFLSAMFMFINVHNLLAQDVFVSNVDNQCLRCLCFAATMCNLTRGCVDSYCGPYKISRIYWADAGKVILPDDDVNREQAFQDCAINYACSQRIVKNYFIKYGQDCNKDGLVNCDDYLMINYNGGYLCQNPLDREENGRQWLDRYYSCYPRTPDAKFG